MLHIQKSEVKTSLFTTFSGYDTTRNIILPLESLIYELYRCVHIKYQQKGKEEHAYSLSPIHCADCT
jgi:hypothetical protein